MLAVHYCDRRLVDSSDINTFVTCAFSLADIDALSVAAGGVGGAATSTVGTEAEGDSSSGATPGQSAVNSVRGNATTELLHHQSNLCLELHHQLQTTRQQSVS